MFWQVPLAYLVDLAVGDPGFLVHPVVIIGRGIAIMEKLLRRITESPIGLRIAGVILTAFIVAGSLTVTYGLIKILSLLNYWVAWTVSIWLISTTIAGKSLKKAAREIYQLLKAKDLVAARQKVGWIVGRDTDNLDEGEITRATVETVAENIVDGIVSPIFYAFIGGAPLAMAYRAANTLDSMVGYKNDKYLYLGWASARFDDVLNYLPARITALLMFLGVMLLKLPVRRTISIVFRDAPKHPSPNSGYPESAVAGALGVQLGGLNYYGGVASHRALMGDPSNKLTAEHILQANRMVDMTGILAVLTGMAFSLAGQFLLTGK